MKKIVFTAVLILSGCAQIPEKLQVPEGTNLASYSLQSSVGEQARWGGVIAKVENLPHKTRLEIVNFKLTSSLRPKASDKTKGRFRVYSDKLLDPMIFKVGKSVTVLGKVEASELGKIGEREVTFPVLQSQNIYLWKNIERYNIQTINEPFWDSRYMYSPFYRGYQRSTVIIKKQNGQSKPLSKSMQSSKSLK